MTKSAAPPFDEPRVVIGKIGATYGLKGWLKVHSFTDPMANILNYAHWWLHTESGEWQQCALINGKPHGKALIAHLEGFDAPEVSRLLTNATIAIPRSHLPPIPDGEFYWFDLLGLEVRTSEGHILGKVQDFITATGNDILVVRNENKEEYLIPFVMKEVIKEVNLDEQTLIIDWDPTPW